jgi:hypothetical protein
VRDADADKINNRFGVQVVPRVLGSVPGITVLADQGRPRASGVVGYWPALISREQVPMRVVVGEDEADVPHPSLPPSPPEAPAGRVALPTTRRGEVPASGGAPVRVPLSRLCLARSGDKGDTANVGVMARNPGIYAWMLDHLTPEFVKARFGEVCKGEVERHEVPNLYACNFLLHESLGGGGTSSLLIDPQGKTYAQYLLAAEVDVDEGLLEGTD